MQTNKNAVFGLFARGCITTEGLLGLPSQTVAARLSQRSATAHVFHAVQVARSSV